MEISVESVNKPPHAEHEVDILARTRYDQPFANYIKLCILVVLQDLSQARHLKTYTKKVKVRSGDCGCCLPSRLKTIGKIANDGFRYF